ncbi:hypothetical protein GCM10010116_35280 [Microbispora rosea subsp. aerata]|nr:PrsW family glutamic-type intramembrane protease [Microbispora rosea]GGO17437.1 hypothetical protein GCM10010116_35280 [Microbispora rosea subsp. aerata]GIH56542.1 hypothetical protein Mro02_34560 [Microbispora rosea subsp. aerata]GLJ81929.1 hypothetical protein GCM10017588_06540 [Microbispora rosea subsp. aerata]
MRGDPPVGERASAAAYLSLRDDEVAKERTLLITRLLIAAYLAYLLLDLVRPKVMPHEPVLTVFWSLPQLPGVLGRLFAMPPIVFWAVLGGIVVGVVLQTPIVTGRFAKGRRATALMWVTVATMLGPFTLISLVVIGSAPLIALACVPGTAFVLWLLYLLHWFPRLSAGLLLAAFGWGALVSFGLSRAYTTPASGIINGYLADSPNAGPVELVRGHYRILNFLVLHVSVVPQIVSAAGVVLLLAWCRHRVRDTLTGLVLGAAAGLGYTFTESVAFIQLTDVSGAITGATRGFEFWIRQSLGLASGNVAFGCVLGAALGLAAQIRHRRHRVLIAGAGLVAATGGAAGTELLSPWFFKLADDHVETGSLADTLVVSPILWLLPQVPFIVLALVLLRKGAKTRAAAARAAVPQEAAVGGAIDEREAPFLADPALRLWAVVSTWRRYGRKPALALARVQSAQLELAAWRWRRSGDNSDQVRQEGERLLTKVMVLKSRAGATQETTP